jgi:putative transposase
LLGNGIHLREREAAHGPILDLYYVGRLRVRWHRPLQGAIKTVTMKREPDGWYVIFSCNQVPVEPLPPTGREVALDMRITLFAVLADSAGEVAAIDNPRYYEAGLRKLRLAQGRLARCQKGSKGYEQAQHLLAEAHLQVKRQRADFHHKAAGELVRAYDTIYREDLSIAQMLAERDEEIAAAARTARNRGMADSAWGKFFAALEAKAEQTSRQVVRVPPQCTSVTCSSCGQVGASWR